MGPLISRIISNTFSNLIRHALMPNRGCWGCGDSVGAAARRSLYQPWKAKAVIVCIIPATELNVLYQLWKENEHTSYKRTESRKLFQHKKGRKEEGGEAASAASAAASWHLKNGGSQHCSTAVLDLWLTRRPRAASNVASPASFPFLKRRLWKK